MIKREQFRLFPCPEQHNPAENGRTSTMRYRPDMWQQTAASRKLKAHDSLIGMKDVPKTTHPPGKPQNSIPAVLHHAGSDVEKPVPQSLQQLLLIQMRQGKPLHPVDNVIGKHSNAGPAMRHVESLAEQTWRSIDKDVWVNEFTYKPVRWSRAYRFVVRRELLPDKQQISLLDSGKDLFYPDYPAFVS